MLHVIRDGEKLFITGLLFNMARSYKYRRALNYPFAVRTEAMRQLEELVEGGTALGRIDPRDATIDLREVSHVVRDLRWAGDNIEVRAEVLDTERGLVLKKWVGAREIVSELYFGCIGMGPIRADNTVEPGGTFCEIAVEIQPDFRGNTRALFGTSKDLPAPPPTSIEAPRPSMEKHAKKIRQSAGMAPRYYDHAKKTRPAQD